MAGQSDGHRGVTVGVMPCWLGQLRAGGIVIRGGEGDQCSWQKVSRGPGHSSELELSQIRGQRTALGRTEGCRCMGGCVTGALQKHAC